MTEQEAISQMLPSTESIFKSKADVNLSINIDYPSFYLGFQHFLHATKRKMETFKSFEGKKKVYLVVHSFETEITDYEKDIIGETRERFKKIKKSPINDTHFFGLWEIFTQFKLLAPKEVTSVNIANETIGAMATMFHRDYFGKSGKKDVYSQVFLQNSKSRADNVVAVKEILDSTESANTIAKKMSKADIITTNLDIEWNLENIQEQSSIKNILLQILLAIKIQKKGGSLLIRVFETFTNVSLKILTVLTFFYKNVNLYRPYTSRPNEQEGYIVCNDYKFSDNVKEIGVFENIVKKALNSKLNVVDIFSEYKSSNDLVQTLREYNLEVGNYQFKFINLMVEFVKGQNYFGDLYHRYRSEQIESNKMWIDKFL